MSGGSEKPGMVVNDENIRPTRLNGQRCWDPLVAFPVLVARDKLLLQTQSLEGYEMKWKQLETRISS